VQPVARLVAAIGHETDRGDRSSDRLPRRSPRVNTRLTVTGKIIFQEYATKSKTAKVINCANRVSNKKRKEGNQSVHGRIHPVQYGRHIDQNLGSVLLATRMEKFNYEYTDIN